MKRFQVIALAVAVMSCSAAAWSQGGFGGGGRGGAGHGGPGGPGGPSGRGGGMMMSAAMAVTPPQASAVGNLADKLQLTDDQTAKLQEVTAAGDKALKPLKQKADDAAKALRTAVLSPRFDAARVKDAAAKAQKAEADVISASISTWTQIRSILTPDQETQLQNLMRDLRPGPGGTPPGPPSGTDGPPAPPSTDQ